MSEIFSYRQPWAGERYGSDPSGRRLFVMGESHYGSSGQLDDPELTRYVVGLIVRGKKTLRFFTTTARVVSGDMQVAVPAFWQGVAYANYCQGGAYSRKEGARPEMWEAGDQAFVPLLSKLKPTHLLLFSQLAYRRLVVQGRDASPSVSPSSMTATFAGRVSPPMTRLVRTAPMF